MWKGRTILAVIPARGGSKGVPRKNLADIGGKTLVDRAVETTSELAWLDMTVLSTDDEQIAAEGRRAGVEVPQLRPAELATDLASGHAVWQHALLEAERHSGRSFELSVLIQPTSPFRRPSDVTACVELVADSGLDAAVTVSPTPSHYSPEKTIVVSDTGRLQPYLSDEFQSTRQLIPTYYHLNGVCYAAARDVILERENVFGPNTGAVVIDRPMVNIDDPFDLKLARLLWTDDD